jgi:hypothetical protein
MVDQLDAPSGTRAARASMRSRGSTGEREQTGHQCRTHQHPNLCGPCDDCRDALLDYVEVYIVEPAKDDEKAAGRTYWRLFSHAKLAPKDAAGSDAVAYTPTEDSLAKHERRFGKDGIPEIRQAFPGVEKPRRRTKAETSAAVIELRQAGSHITQIMRELGIAESTVRRALEAGQKAA